MRECVMRLKIDEGH